MLNALRTAAAATLLVAAAALAASAQTTTVPASPSAAPPSPLPTPANPPENPLVTARVTKEFLAWQHGHIDRSGYSPEAGGTYINAFVALVAPDLQAIGTPETTVYQTAALLLGDLVYRYDITGTSGSVSVLYSLNQNGKTDSIVFTPEIFRTGSAAP
jgi:hypothetical protein